ncbi:MAG: SCP2 sterol-binding domain-containing protein, partial [Planctomycetota bacterium]
HPHEYRQRVSEAETASFWQSLSFGPNYKSAYCLAVCPAGEEVIGPYLDDKQRHLREVVKPLQQKEEVVYVVPGSDAEAHVKQRFRHKRPKPVAHGVHTRSIETFLGALHFVFQWNQSKGLDATYHFRFTGDEQVDATVRIANQCIEVDEGHRGEPDLRVTADAKTWLGFLAGERSLVWALLTRRIRLKGPPGLLVKFGKCFPQAGYRHRRVPDWRESSIVQSVLPRFLRNDAKAGKIVADPDCNDGA